jgi:hypothetical protein
LTKLGGEKRRQREEGFRLSFDKAGVADEVGKGMGKLLADMVVYVH